MAHVPILYERTGPGFAVLKHASEILLRELSRSHNIDLQIGMRLLFTGELSRAV